MSLKQVNLRDEYVGNPRDSYEYALGFFKQKCQTLSKACPLPASKVHKLLLGKGAQSKGQLGSGRPLPSASDSRIWAIMKSVPSSSTPVILIGGPSGSGKSYLAARFGNPHLPLDEFYRQISEDGNPDDFPRTDYGEIDWDHPGTWNMDAALQAIEELLSQGHTMVPNYSISTSSYSGHREVRCENGPIIAEGIFLSEILEPLRARGINVQAYYVDEPALVTTIRRFIRDVSERRKPLLFLIKRGYALFRAHSAGRENYRGKGFTIMPKPELKQLLASLNRQA